MKYCANSGGLSWLLSSANSWPASPSRFRDMPVNAGTTHRQREGRNLLPPLLPECRWFQWCPGGASSDEDGVWERGGGPTGPGFTQAQLSASNNWVWVSLWQLRKRATPAREVEHIYHFYTDFHLIRRKSSTHIQMFVCFLTAKDKLNGDP